MDFLLSYPSVLTVKELNVFRGNSHIIKDLSFTVKRGECVHLKGKNGSGKSTLLEAIAGLIPYKGTVSYESINLCNTEDFLYQELTVKENLSLFLGEFKEPKFGVRELLEKRVGTLSRGERARVSLARASLSRPSVLLFDEITSPLDSDYKEEFFKFIKDFDGVSVITSHDEIPVSHSITLGELR